MPEKKSHPNMPWSWRSRLPQHEASFRFTSANPKHSYKRDRQSAGTRRIQVQTFSWLFQGISSRGWKTGGHTLPSFQRHAAYGNAPKRFERYAMDSGRLGALGSALTKRTGNVRTHSQSAPLKRVLGYGIELPRLTPARGRRPRHRRTACRSPRSRPGRVAPCLSRCS